MSNMRAETIVVAISYVTMHTDHFHAIGVTLHSGYFDQCMILLNEVKHASQHLGQRTFQPTDFLELE